MSTRVHTAIAKRFAAPEWATFFEVRDAAGFNSKRSADAVTMGLWPSRGLELTGFEVKVTRSDWLRELKDPAKSGPVQDYCDRWYVAVSDDTIVQGEELPKTWGLMVLRGGKLVTKVEAPKLEPKALTKTFVAALLRRATENVVPKNVLDEMVSEQVEERMKRRTTNEARDAVMWKTQADNLEAQIRAFEEASGVNIRCYEGSAKIGKAVRIVMNDGAALEKHIERAKQALDYVSVTAGEALDQLRMLTAAGGDRSANANPQRSGKGE